MIFHQLFDNVSCTYSYLIARRRGGEALLIDPVLDCVDEYLHLLEALDLRLVHAVDTHLHADHITGLGALRDRTGCLTVMGAESRAEMVALFVTDQQRLDIDGLTLRAIHTPGHTTDSYCFQLGERIFTGDTLLINSTGRTDFAGGDAAAQYDSLFGKLLRLPDDTLVYPGHDYNRRRVSTIGGQKSYNPRLQVNSVEEYVAIMNSLDLAPPKMMDVAIPANLRLGESADVVSFASE